jgi:hypothetical protein
LLLGVLKNSNPNSSNLLSLSEDLSKRRNSAKSRPSSVRVSTKSLNSKRKQEKEEEENGYEKRASGRRMEEKKENEKMSKTQKGEKKHQENLSSSSSSRQVLEYPLPHSLIRPAFSKKNSTSQSSQKPQLKRPVTASFEKTPTYYTSSYSVWGVHEPLPKGPQKKPRPKSCSSSSPEVQK